MTIWVLLHLHWIHCKVQLCGAIWGFSDHYRLFVLDITKAPRNMYVCVCTHMLKEEETASEVMVLWQGPISSVWNMTARPGWDYKHIHHGFCCVVLLCELLFWDSDSGRCACKAAASLSCPQALKRVLTGSTLWSPWLLHLSSHRTQDHAWTWPSHISH